MPGGERAIERGKSAFENAVWAQNEFLGFDSERLKIYAKVEGEI